VSSTPIRIDNELYNAAKAVAPTRDRSAAQQVAYWARIGRELEASGAISAGTINDVLVGRRPYDSLGPEDQAVVRAVWAERLDSIAGGINLAQQFVAEGRRTWVDIDHDGRVVWHRMEGEPRGRFARN
jgi:ParD-like antitoxin of type II ParDE toxin-antitoxin system